MRRRSMLFRLTIWIGVVSFVGCLFEEISWSPDGRYVAFVESDNDSGKLWQWDSRTNRIENLPLRVKGAGGRIEERGGKPYACRYMPSGDRMLVLADIDDEEDSSLYLMDLETEVCATIETGIEPYWDVSKDGKSILYIKKEAEDEQGAFVEYELGKGKRTVLTSEAGVAFPSYGPEGKRILYMNEESLCVFNRDRGTSRSIMRVGEKGLYWPTWLDANTVLYLLKEADPPIGGLFVYSLDDETTRSLAKNIHVLHPLSISPDRRFVAATMARTDDPKGLENGYLDPRQIATIDLATGETAWISDSIMGAFSPAFSPDGKRLAYQLGFGDRSTLEVFDLESKEKTIAWRDEEERLFLEAEGLARKGHSDRALAAFERLEAQYPDSEFDAAIKLRMLLLYLQPPGLNLDAAYDMLKEYDVSFEYLPELARDSLWPPESKLATDPAEDWIQTYGTNASRQAFEFETDLTRDLRAVWTRWSKERLYVRVDYGSGRDLAGVVFQDTLLLLDYGSPGEGAKGLTPSTEWERGAERRVLVRHWFEAGEKSQYDLEISDAEGEVIGRYLASGFAPPDNPLFDLVLTGRDEKDSGGVNMVVYSISRKVLDLEKPRTVHLQVCTFKGGVESHSGSEKSRVVTADGRPVCDLADAFGPENSRRRIERDSGKSENLGSPAVLIGEAGTFVLE